MRNLVAILFVALTCLHAKASENLTMESAVKIAEKFVAENGYTNLPASSVKQVLNSESVEWASERQKQLEQRFNTLLPSAIGAKTGRKGNKAGWSVAFDYASTPGTLGACRVVTMASDGTDIRVEHVDGVRKYFVGFEKH
ncbi:hypothetical protein [Massilia eburnea]|uniref:hypothetical protein n=1 Tax=Massilia eburnea TaxID=1776165 RepID=UPI003D6BC2F9